jgi:hypothetical protein
MSDGILGNLLGIVKRGAFGGLLQDDSELLNTYLPQSLQQGLSDEDKARFASQTRNIVATGLFSPSVDSTERARQVQTSLLSELAQRQAQQQKAQMDALNASAQDYVNRATQPTITPEMALGAQNIQAGPTKQRAALIGQENPNRMSDAQANANALRMMAQKFQITNPDVAEKYRKQADALDPPFEYAANITQEVDGKPVQMMVGKRGQMQQIGSPYEASPSSVKEYQFAVKQGYPGTYQQFQIEQRKAGASRVDVNTGNTFGKEIATSIAGNAMGQIDAANAAVNTLQTIQSMRQSLPNAIVGSGANQRVAWARLGQTLGFGGKSDADALASTANLVRGSAQIQLDVAKSNKGQGTFTDFERKLLAQAAAGDIDMSPSELTTLFNALEKGSRMQYQEGVTAAGKLRRTKELAPVADFLEVRQLPTELADPLGLRSKP